MLQFYLKKVDFFVSQNGTFWHVRYKRQLNPDLKIKIAIMKTLTIGNFTEFVLSNEEMINVRGGNGAKNDTGDPTRPPVVIEIWAENKTRFFR